MEAPPGDLGPWHPPACKPWRAWRQPAGASLRGRRKSPSQGRGTIQPEGLWELEDGISTVGTESGRRPHALGEETGFRGSRRVSPRQSAGRVTAWPIWVPGVSSSAGCGPVHPLRSNCHQRSQTPARRAQEVRDEESALGMQIRRARGPAYRGGGRPEFPDVLGRGLQAARPLHNAF